jgi:molecular chaperone DnaK (HSP70)
MGKMIGIDLGTTYSVAAIVDGPFPRVLENREARTQTRSVVGLKKPRGKKAEDGGEILVGDIALDNWPFMPRDTIISIKRLMGRGVADPEVQKVREWALYPVVEPADGTKDGVRVVMGGKHYSPIDISAMILKKVKEDAEFRLGQEVSHAVITVPAYFSQIQRDATRKAGLKAGLKVIKILDEPTAAAIAFGMDAGDANPKTVLVYDLGGGTFDISVLMWAGNVFAPLNVEGDMWLGGDDMDQVVVDHVLRQVKEDYGVDPTASPTTMNLRFLAELKKAASAAKERLSATRSATLIVAGMLKDENDNPIDVDLDISREEFERMILPLVGRFKQCSCREPNYPQTEACAKCGRSLRTSPVQDGKAVRLVRKALQNANLTSEQIDHVLMAGNCTTVPLVQQSMEEMFGPERILRKVHPKHSVAMGAAIVAAMIGDRVVCHAPDPSDPKRECGYVNKPEATVCANPGCGASLQLGPTPPESPEKGKGLPPEVSLGTPAPFHYGTQSAGDRYTIFVKKGDPCPTQNPHTEPFFTRVPNQRMISIPVYGGDNLEKASANEKQGEAFAILPPGLVSDTLIRIRLTLDGNGIFELAAHLEDGTDLKPWIVAKGEANEKAIQAIERAEQVLAQKEEVLSPEDRKKVDVARNRVFDRLRNQDFEGGLHEAEAFAELAAEVGPGGGKPADLQTQAQNLIGFAEFILHQYGWGLDPNYAYRLNNAVEETRNTLESGKMAALAKNVAALDQLTDNIPDVVKPFLAVRGAILSRIRPRDPVLAGKFLQELDSVEAAVKSNQVDSPQRFVQLAKRVGEAIGELPEGAKCSRGHQVPPGERYCPVCHDDTWQPRGKTSGSTFGEYRPRR